MQGKQRRVMWPRLVANKLLRKRLGSNEFIADFPNAEPLKEDPSSIQPIIPRLLSKEHKDTKKYKVFVSTWNLAGIAPSDDLNLEDWLDTCNNSCDIYVFGFQEAVPLSAGNVLGPENIRITTKWNSLIRAALNKKIPSKKNQEPKAGKEPKIYPVKDGDNSSTDQCLPLNFNCIISKQMVGIFISVWVRGDLWRYIRHPHVSCVGCGIMGCLGNKGSVSVRFFLHETSFCFVCSHLASGGKDRDEMHRNSDVAEILSRTIFPRGPSFDLPRKILNHDRVIWLGDLNYRISMPESMTRSLIEKEDWNTLLENDQLRDELSEGRVFEGWQEEIIQFAPTYKYYPNSDKYYGFNQTKKGEKRRLPAWCDRILWYGKGLKQKEYRRGESRLSDHRPVKAVFDVEVDVLRNLKAFDTIFISERFDLFTDGFDVFASDDFPSHGRFSFRI